MDRAIVGSACTRRRLSERGPKNKRPVAFSIDWPGWSRGRERQLSSPWRGLEAYRDRYRPIATLARMSQEFDDAGR